MNILLTNDDGIDGEGFLDLAQALRLEGHTVYVLAPDTNRSGVSNALSFYEDVQLQQRGAFDWTCGGTPADCVRIGILGGLSFKPDLVISGINAGTNIGTDLIYSGTAAAARQAALYGVPGLAFSLMGEPGSFLWGPAIEYTLGAFDELRMLWREDVFINVNIPNTAKPGKYRITYPALRAYRDVLTASPIPGGGISCSIALETVETQVEPGSDWEAITQGHVSVSPVFLHPVVRRDRCPGVPDHCGVGPRPGKTVRP